MKLWNDCETENQSFGWFWKHDLSVLKLLTINLFSMHNNHFIFFGIFLFFITSCAKQITENLTTATPQQIKNLPALASNGNQDLFNHLQEKDSLLFQIGFNKCDTAVVRKLISNDFEFYHDQSGVLNSNETFILGIAGLCQMNYEATRELTAGTLKVFPLYNNGNLYGAIQSGEHSFYGEEKDKPKYLTSNAKFTHVWILENAEWKLKRVLSYDHVTPKN